MQKKQVPLIHKTAGIALAKDNILYSIESCLEPSVMVAVLWAISFYFEENLLPPYLILSVILFSLAFPSQLSIHQKPWAIIKSVSISWTILASLILFFGLVTDYINIFPETAITTWLWLTPISLVLSMLSLRASAPWIMRLQGPSKKIIIAGMNNQGIALAESFSKQEHLYTSCVGFFDDRNIARLDHHHQYPLLGKFCNIAEYVKKHNISTIYLSLPMASQPRILKLLDDLKDTTASIYFLPDTFLTDIIQGRMGQVNGIPVVAICETPITGINAALKRLIDIVIATSTLILISPLLLMIASCIKISSPGPILFRQLRFGLDGHNIIVYKFRSMTVCENGSIITQARKNDRRVTRVGGVLRKTSLDELPQLFNVLQGNMSLVGPRPHAIAHNEMYRKLIKGYMVRHKVKPGITGWAQVNGFRGETETLDKMQARIEYDIDYLRNWSIKLDILILLKTGFVLLKGQNNAY